ncbi:MAG: hypothetical protein GXO65_07460 [Euryarchaeota archaeon]|nr:hypothetical protein [Euryarchaeota archaeon]
MQEFGQIIFGTRLEWNRGILPELMAKFGISRKDLLRSYRLSDPSAEEVDRLMAEFYDVDKEALAEFKKELSDGIVKEASRLQGIKEVTCLVNFVFDEEIKTNYPELLIEAAFSHQVYNSMDDRAKDQAREKIARVAEGVLEKSLSVRNVDVSPEKKNVSVKIKEALPSEKERVPAVKFIKEVEDRLSEVFNEAMVKHLMSWHLDSLGATRETIGKEKAHQFIMALIPDIIAQSGIMEGLKISQEIKNIYKKEFLEA